MTTSASSDNCIFGLLSLHPQALKTLQNCFRFLCDNIRFFMRHQTADLQLDLPDHFAILDNDLTSPALCQAVACHRHGFLVRADDDHVMAVVGNRGSDGALALEAKPADKPHHDAARAFMAFDQRDLGDVAFHVGFDLTILRSNVKGQMAGRSLVFDDADDIGFDLRLDYRSLSNLKSSAFNRRFSFTDFVAQEG